MVMTIQQNMYKTTVKVVGGREGYAESSSPALRLDIRTPKELGGAGADGTNPEQLFAAGYGACFDSALHLVARTQRIKHEGTEIHTTVSLGKVEDGGFGIAVNMDVLVKGVDRETASRLVQEAHRVCPYSRATAGNIAVEFNIL